MQDVTVENSGKNRNDVLTQKQLMNRQNVERDRVALERLKKLGGYRNRAPLSEEEKELVRVTQYCWVCGSEVVVDPMTQELVCVEHGHVWGFLLEQKTIPLDEESVEGGHAEGSYSPEVPMDFEGGGMGSHVDRLEASNILRGDPETSNETYLNGRGANIARVPLCHPLVKDLLRWVSDFCLKYELNQSSNKHHAWFAHQLAIYLRKLGEFYVEGSGKKFADPYRISASIFCSMFKDAYPERYNAIRSGKILIKKINREGKEETREYTCPKGENEKKFAELFLPDETVRYFLLLLQSCHPVVLPRPPERSTLEERGDSTS